MRATNMREVTLIFREYSKKIHAKADRSDPNFMRISVTCGKVCYLLLSSWIAELTSLPQIEEYCEKYCWNFFYDGNLDERAGAAFILTRLVARDSFSRCSELSFLFSLFCFVSSLPLVPWNSTYRQFQLLDLSIPLMFLDILVDGRFWLTFHWGG